MTNYIFSAGTARGGTGLLTRMLSVHPKVEIALDPYLSIYKELRNTLVKEKFPEEISKKYDFNSPISSYYFSKGEINLFKKIIGSNLKQKFPENSEEKIIKSLSQRSKLSSGDLSNSMNKLNFKEDFKNLFISGLNLIKEKRQKSLDWVGIHENWTVEFLPTLAREFNNAKFFILTRDPRAVITSSLMASDPSIRGQITSYARCLRKLFACSIFFKNLEIFKDRLLVVKYEDLILKKEETCIKLCEFLSIDYKPEMLDTNNFVEPSTGGIYNGFSSYENQAQNISSHRISRWRNYLSKENHQLIDFLCGPEMKLAGYENDFIFENFNALTDIVPAIENDLKREVKWRCDLRDFKNDLGNELLRYSLIKSSKIDLHDLTEQTFLFNEIFEKILHNQN